MTFFSQKKKKLTFAPKDPLSIFSNPTARVQSEPDSMNCFANMRADAPVEQLLFTLNTGTPVMPISYKALCPLVESPENVEGKWILFNFD